MRRALVRRAARLRVTRVARAQEGDFLAQLGQFLAELEYRLVLLDHMALQVRVALLEQGESCRFVHGPACHTKIARDAKIIFPSFASFATLG